MQTSKKQTLTKAINKRRLAWNRVLAEMDSKTRWSLVTKPQLYGEPYNPGQIASKLVREKGRTVKRLKYACEEFLKVLAEEDLERLKVTKKK